MLIYPSTLFKFYLYTCITLSINKDLILKGSKDENPSRPQILLYHHST